jgi:hypothetical protein
MLAVPGLGDHVEVHFHRDVSVRQSQVSQQVGDGVDLVDLAL